MSEIGLFALLKFTHVLYEVGDPNSDRQHAVLGIR